MSGPDGSAETGSGGDNVSANVSTNNRRCNIGYNDNGPLCATCEAGYVLMKGTCEPCDGMGAKAAARINLLMYFGVVMMVLIFWLFVTQRLPTEIIQDQRHGKGIWICVLTMNIH